MGNIYLFMIEVSFTDFEQGSVPQRAFNLSVIQIFLAGLFYLLGRPFTRGEWAAARNQAYRVRGAIQAVDLRHDTNINNEQVIQMWSRDGRPHWCRSMGALWLYFAPRINRFLRAAWLYALAGYVFAPYNASSLRAAKVPP